MSNPNFGVWRPMAENVEFNALESNSNAVMAVADTVRTTLGPKGLDKLLIDQAMNRHVSNDGVTILLSLRAIHPVARMIVEIAERQEQLVGDGTTTAVVMSAEMIKEGKKLVRELGVHPTKVVNGIVLERTRLDPEMPLEIKEPKIMIVKMNMKPVKDAWLKENSKYQDILTMENDRLGKAKQIVDSIIATGANAILIASPEVDQVVEDLLVAKRLFAVRISTEEIEYLSRYTGAKPVRMLEDLSNKGILGSSSRIYENEQDQVIYVENGSNQNIVTVIISGSTKETSQERWRAVIDGVNAAEAALNNGVVAGGGSAELHIMEKVKKLRLKGLEQVGLDVVMAALESIMRQILTNAGFNGLEKVMAARSSPEGFGIDINTGDPVDMWKIGIIDPLLVKTMALKAAAEIAKSVLRIDRNLAAEDLSPQALSESKR